MDKKEFRNKLLIMSAGLLIYLLVVLSGNLILINITSPVITSVAGCFIMSARNRIREGRLGWALLASVAFSWSLVDILWLMLNGMAGFGRIEIPVFMYLYLIPDILLAMTAFAFFYQSVRRWYTVQVVLNLVATLIMAFIFIWHIVLKDYDMGQISLNVAVGFFSNVIIDIISISVMLVMYFQIKSRKSSMSFRMSAVGIFIFGMTDFLFTYLTFESKYVPVSLINFSYRCAIYMLCIASLYEAYKPAAVSMTDYSEIPEKNGRMHHYIIVLVLPLIFYLTGRLTANVVLQMILVLILYQILSNIIQGNMKNQYLLKKEKDINEKLEAAVGERTRELLAANKALDKLVMTDTLTGLYNRRYFLEELDNIISRGEGGFSILYMDLDRFKTINDTYGHDMGDLILLEISKRLMGWRDKHADSEDMIAARLGGDEFSFIIKGDISTESLEVLCMEIIGFVNEPIVIEPYVFNVGVSIGVSRYPIDAIQREQLVKFADIAMYNAKREYGCKSFTLYSHDRSEVIQKRNEIEMLLRKVDFDKEFELYYQPQFRISDNQLIGAEALLRWNSPIKGRISPLDFIPLAEETGLILDIGSWVMEKAVSQICNWNSKYGLKLQMGINISPRQIDSVDFLPGIRQLMERTGFDPGCLDFEITESSAMNTNVIMEEILTELSGMGINISIDDFGSGYSSLSYIKRFDIDRLKIAKELIDNISRDQNDLHIVKAIIMMAKGLGLYTIAEGVETHEQLNLLRMLGCDEVQGYLSGKPMPVDDFEESLLVTRGAKVRNE